MNRPEKLDFIASQLQKWLDSHEQNMKQNGIQVSDILHFRALPDWVSRGELKEWICVLRDESKRDTEDELFHRQLWRNLQQMKKNEAKIKALENET